MHDTGHTHMANCASVAQKTNPESADWDSTGELKAINTKYEISDGVSDGGFDGHVSDEVCDTIEKVNKGPERKKKIKRTPEPNVRKKCTNPRNDVNETFQ